MVTKKGNEMSVLQATHVVSGFSIEEIGRSGHGRITAKILGFWSSDSITLYIERQVSWNRDTLKSSEAKWVASMTHSSGGRDPKEVQCDLEAEMNFSTAMRALVSIGRDIINLHSETLEKEFQAERARFRAIEEERKAKKAAEIAADPAMGFYPAERKIDILARTGTGFAYHKRGSDSVMTFSVQRREKTRFYVNNMAVSRKGAIMELSMLSARQYKEPYTQAA